METSGVNDVVTIGPLLDTGASRVITITGGGIFTNVSVASMLTPTNDGFFALNRVKGLTGRFAVYIVTGAAFFGYAFVLSRRQRKMSSEIDALQQVLSERKYQAISDEGE